MPVAYHGTMSQASQEHLQGSIHGEEPPIQGSVHVGSSSHDTIHGTDQEDSASRFAVHGSSMHGTVHDESAPPSKDTSQPGSASDAVHRSSSSPRGESLASKQPAVHGTVHSAIH